jgi:hypothetical protein
VAFVSFAIGTNLSRGFILLALPFALCLDVIGRYVALNTCAKRATGRAIALSAGGQ